MPDAANEQMSKIHVDMTRREFIAANQIAAAPEQRNTLWTLVIGCGVAFILLRPLGEMTYLRAGLSAGLIWVVGFGLFIIGAQRLRAWRNGRAYDRDPVLRVPCVIEYTDAGLGRRNEFGGSTYPWVHWKKWQETRNLIMATTAQGNHLVIPTRCLQGSEDAARFRQLLTDRIGPAT